MRSIKMKFLGILMTGVFGILMFVVWMAKTTDWIIKFWPFFCLLMIPLLLLSFFWIGFAHIGMVLYFMFCAFKAHYDMQEMVI